MDAFTETQVGWIASRLRELRYARGLSLKQVANRIGHNHHSRISNYEILRVVPHADTFFALLDALEISPAEFFRAMPVIEKVGSALPPPCEGGERSPKKKRLASPPSS